MIIIKIAQNHEEKKEIYKLRYRVYVEEMKRSPEYADKVNKTIEEPYDRNAILFYAEDDGAVVGTVTVHSGENIPQKYVDIYRIGSIMTRFPGKASITTKFIIDMGYRKTNAAFLLALEIFKYAQQNDIIFNFIDTNPYLLRLYQKLGYRFYTGNISHPDYGNVIPLVIFEDAEYMKSIKSPLYLNCSLTPHFTSEINHFKGDYMDYMKMKPFFSLPKEEKWKVISGCIEGKPNLALGMLNSFSEEDSMKILNFFDYVTYEKNTYIFQENPSFREFYCVLEGRVEITFENNNPYAVTLSKGGIFGYGCTGFNGNTGPRVRTTEKTKLLLLNDAELLKLQKRHPKLTDKFLENIANYSLIYSEFSSLKMPESAISIV